MSGSPGRELLAAVRRATAESFAAEWAELAAFAAGAGVPADDLVLLNLRGDLGPVDGGVGCSDLGWRRDRSVIAHNEDGALEDVGRCALLTMTGTGRPPVTAFWYPGFLPANAFALTGDGLVWTVDHLPVASPGPGPAVTSPAAGCSVPRGRSTRSSATCERIRPRAVSPTRSATGRAAW